MRCFYPRRFLVNINKIVVPQKDHLMNINEMLLQRMSSQHVSPTIGLPLTVTSVMLKSGMTTSHYKPGHITAQKRTFMVPLFRLLIPR